MWSDLAVFAHHDNTMHKLHQALGGYACVLRAWMANECVGQMRVAQMWLLLTMFIRIVIRLMILYAWYDILLNRTAENNVLA